MKHEEAKCPIDANVFECPDCGQVLGPMTPAQLQATAWPYHALYSLRHRRGAIKGAPLATGPRFYFWGFFFTPFSLDLIARVSGESS